jgi:hypothetical protein
VPLTAPDPSNTRNPPRLMPPPCSCRMGLEGIVSKQLSAPYCSGPSRDWLKIKNPDSPAMLRAREAKW